MPFLVLKRIQRAKEVRLNFETAPGNPVPGSGKVHHSRHDGFVPLRARRDLSKECHEGEEGDHDDNKRFHPGFLPEVSYLRYLSGLTDTPPL